MNLDKYPVISTNEHLIYEFFSEGPNGTIKKVVVLMNCNLTYIIWLSVIGMKQHSN